MELQQTFLLPFARDAVWRCFHDTEGVVACLPGASLSAPPRDGKLPLTMTVKLGPIVAAFAGDGEMRLDDASYRGAVTGTGADRKSGSRVKGEAAFSLHDVADATGGPATRVDIAVDYAIAGSLAQFSRGGIVRELAARLTEAFAANLRRKLEAEAGAGATVAAAAVAEPPAFVETAPRSPGAASAQAPTDAPTNAPTNAPPNAPPNAPLDLNALFWPALWARLRQWLSFGRR
ncbi:SRPBCC family protein [Cupriavidus gilardii]|uniref:SRPBCC family protein n=1 Tax=Cupriavidus gilardii TaxID=82541 RepID=A0ABY4VND5_9BURK|nr:SRPBCC family protein [Cupriavidus gilardii]USE76853.1 SRPBCC family protein [Cupriavidus gilardii]